MPTFEWKGRGRTGETAGVLVADSKDSVITTLRRQQIVVTAVKEKGKEIAGFYQAMVEAGLPPRVAGRIVQEWAAISFEAALTDQAPQRDTDD